MRQYAGANWPNPSQPSSSRNRSRPFPEAAGCGRQYEQRPVPVPGVRTLAIDPSSSCGETPPTRLGQTIFAVAAAAPRAKPAVLRETRDRSTHQPLGQAKRSGQSNQTAQRHDTAARRDRIPEDRHQQRAAAQRALAAEPAAEGVQRGVNGSVTSGCGSAAMGWRIVTHK